MNYISSSARQFAPISDFVKGSGLIRDGDWVESKDQDPEGGVRLIQLADVGVGAFLDKSARFLTAQKAKELRCTYLHSGDILVARMPDPIGRACIFPGDKKKAVTVVDVCIVRPNPKLCDPRWLCWMINAPDFTDSVLQQARGATRQRIARTELERLVVPCISLSEQRRIAAILDEADALRAKRRATLAGLGELATSVFVQTTTTGNYEIEIGDALAKGILVLHKDGNHGSLYPRPEDFGAEGVPFITAKSVTDEGDIQDAATERLEPAKAAALRHGWVREGDVLLAHNASVGRVGICRGEYETAIVGTSLTIFRCNEIVLLPTYLFAALRSSNFQDQLTANMGQTTRNQVPITAQRLLRIPVPKIDFQRVFVAKLQEIEKCRHEAAKHMRKLDSVFASLQHRAFRGEL